MQPGGYIHITGLRVGLRTHVQAGAADAIHPSQNTSDPTRDVATVEPEPMEDRMMNGEDPTAEDTQDVTYAHMNRCTLSERIFTPISLSPTSSSAESRQALPVSLAKPRGSSRTACNSSVDSHLGFDRFSLYQDDGAHVPGLPDILFQNSFLVGPVTSAHAGTYRCHGYYSHFPCVVSTQRAPGDCGLYDKPSLSTDGCLVVMPGESVSLRCSSAHISFNGFSLSKDGRAVLSQHQNGGRWGDFILGPVNLSFSGIYTCYSWYSGSPYVWSAPSDALELVVTDTSHPVPFVMYEKGTYIVMWDTTNQDYTTENLIRIGMAGLPLVALLAILAENWLGHQVPHEEDQQDLPELSCSRQKTQTEWTFGLTPKGLSLSQRTSAQKQTLSKPVIWAKPSFMIPKGTLVIIWCQGTHEAVEYQLHFEGGLSAFKRPESPGMVNRVKFPIPDPLDLVVTGLYDTPTLSVQPRPEVTSGENVTFRCRLETATSTFFLLKEGRPSRPQRRYGNIQAEFPMGPVSTAHRGTYRCFGSYNKHTWSFPSEPVKLLVEGHWDSYMLTTETQFQEDPVLWDHNAQNLLRIGLVFLVLVALVWLLVEDWLHRKKPQDRASRASSQECRRRQRELTRHFDHGCCMMISTLYEDPSGCSEKDICKENKSMPCLSSFCVYPQFFHLAHYNTKTGSPVCLPCLLPSSRFIQQVDGTIRRWGKGPNSTSINTCAPEARYVLSIFTLHLLKGGNNSFFLVIDEFMTSS
ncbi:hypothetical protein E2I00_009753 [Balaenoptera physalus]|uniref:Natural cytotoxicity triggering receptor 1 n=1 Tax=Balaenoptera physalus TaxID=9770 RepID=A0A643C948_BALPH|nr:hypothetical protein E2I00_009753 [Balaenoptera physalus]